MKSVLAALVLFGSVSAFAETVRIDCRVLYTNPKGDFKADVRQIVEVEPFQAQSFDLGTLKLVVNAGGSATLADDSVHTVVSVQIYDSKYQAPQAGQVSVSPRFPAEVSYRVEDSNEALTARCAVAR